jgi:hypothetical protein
VEVNFKVKCADRDLQVTIDVWCHDRDGDYGYDDLYIECCESGAEVLLQDLPDKAQALIERHADEHAADAQCEAYQDYIEARADAEYDRMRDDMYD